MLKYLQKVVSAVGILYCFSISKPENAKEFTKFCKCFRDFVNALAFSKGEMLKFFFYYTPSCQHHKLIFLGRCLHDVTQLGKAEDHSGVLTSVLMK